MKLNYEVKANITDIKGHGFLQKTEKTYYA